MKRKRLHKLSDRERKKMFHYIQKFKWHNTLLFVIILFWAGINVVSSLVLTWLLDAIIDGKWQTFLFWAAMDVLCWVIYSFLQATKDTFKERII